MSIYLGTERLATNIAGNTAINTITVTDVDDVETTTINGDVIILDPTIRTEIDSPVDIVGCLDVTTLAGTEVGTVGTRYGVTDGDVLAGNDSFSYTLDVGQSNSSFLFTFPDFPSAGVYRQRNASSTAILLGVLLTESIPSGTVINIIPSTLLTGNPIVTELLQAGGNTLVVTGDLSSQLIVGSFISWQATFNGIISSVTVSGGNTTIVLEENFGLGGIPPGFTLSNVLYSTDPIPTTAFAEQQTVILERDLTRIISTNIQLGDDETDHRVRFVGIKSGTLASPPAGLLTDEAWEDTTDSTTDPILRIHV